MLTEFGLFSGREMDSDELQELIKAQRSKIAKAKAAAMVGLRPLSEFELKKKLAEKGTFEKDADEAAQWLKDIGAVNDLEYASQISRRFAAKGYGAAKIKDELYKRGIPRDMWDEALSLYNVSENAIDRFLVSKLKGSLDKNDIRKAADALYRRGFSWDEIQAALHRYEISQQDD